MKLRKIEPTDIYETRGGGINPGAFIIAIIIILISIYLIK